MFFLSIMAFFIFAISGIHFAMVGDYLASFLTLTGTGLVTTATVFMKSFFEECACTQGCLESSIFCGHEIGLCQECDPTPDYEYPYDDA